MTRTCRLLVLLLAAALPDCGGSPIRILSPLQGELLSWAPVTISIDMSAAADPQTLVVLLNGNDITSQFSIDDPPSGLTTAFATGVWGGQVLPGANTLRAQVWVGSLLRARQIDFTTEGDPYADAVQAFLPGSGAGFGQQSAVLGPPMGAGVFQGTLDVLSLGLGGRIDLEFVDNEIVDGAGVDFTVFENALLEIDPNFLSGPPFSEPARVSVSQDGISWWAFDCDLQPGASPYYPGCAGVYPVLSDANDPQTPHASIPSSVPIEDLVGLDVFSFPIPAGAGGDSYDLAEVGLAWARFVRIESAGFDTPPSGANNKGFDLDAVAAVHSAPPSSVP